jgi:hypothetical protein
MGLVWNLFPQVPPSLDFWFLPVKQKESGATPPPRETMGLWTMTGRCWLPPAENVARESIYGNPSDDFAT